MIKRKRILRSDLISRVAFISLTAGVLAGCSAATERFGEAPVYTGGTSNQRSILSGGKPQPSYQDIVNGPGGTIAGLPQASSQPVYTGSIPAQTRDIQQVPVQSRPLQSAAVRAVSTPVTTVGTSDPKSWRGWSSAGGTRVPVRSGDTVNSLSRRYGVPVKAIAAVNDIEYPGQVQPGQTLIIPTYVYSSGNGASSASTSEDRPVRLPAPGSSASLTTASVSSSSANGSTQPARKPARQSGFSEIVAGVFGRTGNDSRADATAAPQTTAPLNTASIPTGTAAYRSAPYPARKPSRQPSFAEISSNQVVSDATPIQIGTSPKRKPNYSGASVQSASAPSVSGQVPSPRGLPEKTQSVTGLAASGGAEAKPTKPIERPQIVASVDPVDDAAPRFRWPVRGRIISDFGAKPGGSRNDGVNLAVPEGTPVKAADAGTVIYSGNELKGFGNLVLLRHADGWVSAYAHNSKLNVKRGDAVARGEVIANAGASGSVSQPQVHFELRQGNKPVDPLRYLPKS